MTAPRISATSGVRASVVRVSAASAMASSLGSVGPNRGVESAPIRSIILVSRAKFEYRRARLFAGDQLLDMVRPARQRNAHFARIDAAIVSARHSALMPALM